MAAEPDKVGSPEEPYWPSNYFNYFTEVEERFQKARGTGLFLLSPLDWALIEAWKNAGIPLEAVLRGVDAAFEKWRSRKNRARPLSSFRLSRKARSAAVCRSASSYRRSHTAMPASIPSGDSSLPSFRARSIHIRAFPGFLRTQALVHAASAKKQWRNILPLLAECASEFSSRPSASSSRP